MPPNTIDDQHGSRPSSTIKKITNAPTTNADIMDTYQLLQVANDEEISNGCSILMMILLSTPRLAAAMTWAALYSGLSSYLENLMSSYLVQLTQLLGPLIGLLLSPTIGVLSDNCTSRFGRRRPFLLGAAISLTLCWTILGYADTIGRALGDTKENRSYTAIISSLLFIWICITVNVLSTPAQLILSDFAGDRQTTAAAIGQAAFTLGALIVSIYIVISGEPVAKTLQSFLLFLSVIMVVVIGLVCIFAKEIPFHKKEKKYKNSNDDIESKNEDNSLDNKYDKKVKITTCSIVLNIIISIYTCIRDFSKELLVLGFLFFCRCYGSTSYHGAKSQFFGIVIYGGDSRNADDCQEKCLFDSINCNECTLGQNLYNKGARLAGGSTEILFCIVGYIISWFVPFIVRKIGAKMTVTIGMIPQILFIYMALCRDSAISVGIVVSTAITQSLVDSCLVPIIKHVSDKKNEENIGVYVGVFNSFDCLGQLINFAASSLLVNTSYGYGLPIMVGGIVSFLGFLTGALFLHVKLYSL